MNVLIFLLSLLVTSTTIADKPKTNPISNKISILLSEKTNFSKKNNRKLIASLLLKQLTQLDSLIPYNTPAERSWLEKEKAQSNKRSKRYLHMLDSAIFAKWWLKDRISVTGDWLKENQSDNITEKQEALNWIAIIYTLTPELDMFNQSLGILVRNDIINENKLHNLIGYEAFSPDVIYSDFDFFPRQLLIYVLPKLING